MPYRKVNRDRNQQPIIDALRKVGAFVYDASHVGSGFPDLIVSRAEQVYLLEVKNPETRYGRRGMSLSQQEFSEVWRGIPIQVVRSVDEALAAIGVRDGL